MLKNKTKSNKLPSIILSVTLLLMIILIILNPSHYISVSLNAILIWAKILLPSLLPFFIFTKLIDSLGIIKDISSSCFPFTKKLYSAPEISSYIFFMSILTGYPVGSKIVSEAYFSGEISKSSAKKIITFTSNSGPMFIVGSVGAGLLLDVKVGYIILLSHILGAIFNGLLYRNIKEDNVYFTGKVKNTSSIQNTAVFADSVNNSVSSILMIGGIIVMSFIIIDIIQSYNILYPITSLFEKIGIPKQLSTAILSGGLEITKGCQLISALNISKTMLTTITCFIISFGGFSTILQAMAFLKGIVSFKFFTLQKFTHAIFSTIICFFLYFVFGFLL